MAVVAGEVTGIVRLVRVVQRVRTSGASALGRGGQGCPQRQLAGAERLRIMLARQHGSPLPLARAEREDVRSTEVPAPEGAGTAGRAGEARPALPAQPVNQSGYIRVFTSACAVFASEHERSYSSAVSAACSAARARASLHSSRLDCAYSSAAACMSVV